MGFSQSIREDVFVSSARHCCVCHRYRGVKVEVHHIIPREQGGEDSFDNAIALCFDCHCDAGHYFAKHPKGSKFTPAELKKHRDSWYDIVKLNKIDIIEDDKTIYCRYFVTQSEWLIEELIRGDLTHFPISNTLLHNNTVLNFQKSIMGSPLERPYDTQFSEITEEQYLLKHADAIRVYDNQNHQYKYTRTPSEAETKEFCNRFYLEKFILEATGSAKNIIEIFAHQCSGCGGDNFEEFIVRRSLWACYLCISNISNHYIDIREVKYTGTKDLNSVQLYKSLLENPFESFALPQIKIPPNFSVLIPILTLLAPFRGGDVVEIPSQITEIENKPNEIIRSAKVDINNLALFDVLGPGFIPHSVDYVSENSSKSLKVHNFDFSNMYFYSKEWMGGCCPHVFLKLYNEIKYYGEIFSKATDIEQYFRIIAPEGATEFYLCELEYEATFIKSIKINSEEIISNLILERGEGLEFRIKKGDIIEGTGYYSCLDNSNKLAAQQKNELVKKFIEKQEINIIKTANVR